MMMDIVFCTDNNYVMPCGITMISLFENNEGRDITIHIIGMDLDEANKTKLKGITNKYDSTINFYNIDEGYLKKFNFAFDDKNSYINISTYIRLFITEILPDNIDKILYLDSDLIILEDISELWNTSMENYSAAGVIDNIAFDTEVYSRLQFPEKFLYINAGVLLINLAYWRNNNVLRNFIEYETKNHTQIKYQDQDIINGTLHSSILRLPLKYNMHSAFYLRKGVLGLYEDELIEPRNRPTIIHFTMVPKPWLKGSFHPRVTEFIEYKKLSIWRDTPVKWGENIPLNKKIKYYKRILLYALGLKKSKYVKLSGEKRK